MPELPEVETVKRGLQRTIVGKTISAVEIRVPKLFADDRELVDQVLIGATVSSVERKAKILLIHLSSSWTLAVHLKMTGQLIVVRQQSADDSKATKAVGANENDSLFAVDGELSAVSNESDSVAFVGGHPEKAYEQPLPHRHTHVTVSFGDGTQLYFNDLRKFGWMKLFVSEQLTGNSEQKTIDEFIKGLRLGPEPLSDDFTPAYLENLVAKRSVPIKQLLLEQKGISGIGNIYADEALFYAKVHPLRPANQLSSQEIALLTEGIKVVLEKGIEFGGTSKNTYLNVEGTKGEMQKYLMVYGREALPCRVCGTPLVRIKIGQRSSHFCPNCQV